MWDKSPVLFADVVEKAAVKRVKDIATDMLTAVVDRSPVDTGRFAANNRIGIGAPNNEYNPNDFTGRAGAMSRGMTAISSMDDSKLQNIHLTNLTPYGKYLESGWSRQAVNGVYRVSFMGVAAWYK